MTQNDVLQAFISGAIMMGYCVCALFFLRFWRSTADRLFVVFSAAFWLLAIQRLMLAVLDPLEEWRTSSYVMRLVAFLLILGAIVDKNRNQVDRSGHTDATRM